jgi:hypothetical protein
MFKSISFVVLAIAVSVAHADNFDKEQSTMTTLSNTIFMNEKTVFDDSFTSELTVSPADLVYGGSEQNTDAANFDAFNKDSISKELSAKQ